MNNITIASRRRTLIAVALFGIACGVALPPAIADSLDTPQRVVRYADLNLDTPVGTAVLYARIQSAAKNVCLQFDGRSLGELTHREGCIDLALRGAIAKLNSPALADVYHAKTGKEVPMRLLARQIVR